MHRNKPNITYLLKDWEKDWQPTHAAAMSWSNTRVGIHSNLHPKIDTSSSGDTNRNMSAGFITVRSEKESMTSDI